jgi:hypothetical protein
MNANLEYLHYTYRDIEIIDYDVAEAIDIGTKKTDNTVL